MNDSYLERVLEKLDGFRSSLDRIADSLELLVAFQGEAFNKEAELRVKKQEEMLGRGFFDPENPSLPMIVPPLGSAAITIQQHGGFFWHYWDGEQAIGIPHACLEMHLLRMEVFFKKKTSNEFSKDAYKLRIYGESAQGPHLLITGADTAFARKCVEMAQFLSEEELLRPIIFIPEPGGKGLSVYLTAIPFSGEKFFVSHEDNSPWAKRWSECWEEVHAPALERINSILSRSGKTASSAEEGHDEAESSSPPPQASSPASKVAPSPKPSSPPPQASNNMEEEPIAIWNRTLSAATTAAHLNELFSWLTGSSFNLRALSNSWAVPDISEVRDMAVESLNAKLRLLYPPEAFDQIMDLTASEMRNVGWGEQNGRQYLNTTFGCNSRTQLHTFQLFTFWEYLKSQPRTVTSAG